MKIHKSRLHILDKHQDLSELAKTGVSLHCHTQHSKELLDFIPYYAERLPIVSYFWEKECRRYLEREGKLPNFKTGFWLPPLTGDEVYESEKAQMNRANLNAIVSITDHDTITANLEINQHLPNTEAPISMEWTVPYKYAFLHVGVHNLPPKRAAGITAQLLDYTAQTEDPCDQQLHAIFALLNELPETLVVLNHPLWDIEMIGDEPHRKLLKDFLAEHGKWIHAFEINGFRSWSENKTVLEMADALGFPLVSGGDRHCCHYNTTINLTNAKSFAEFAEEIRVDKHSQVVLMPEYRQPLASRQISSIAEILSDYSEFPAERRCWMDRVHVDVEDGAGLRPLSSHWKKGGPKWLRWVFRTIAVLNHQTIRPVFQLTMDKRDRVPPPTAIIRRRSTIIGSKPLTVDG